LSILSSIRTVIAFLFRRARIERETEEELRSHLQSRADDLERQGLSRAQAERQARIEFGGYQRYKEECREALGTRLLGELLADVRYGLRQLSRNPGFTAVAVITLTLGIAATTVVFTVGEAIFFRPMPLVPRQDRLVAITQRGNFWASSAPANFRDWKEHARSFSSMAAEMDFQPVTLKAEIGAERVPAAFVTPGFFTTVRVSPELGRRFLSEEYHPGHAAVILAYGFWQQRFGGTQRIIGSTIDLDGKPATVVGVMPRIFNFPAGSDMWLPLQYTAQDWNDRRDWKLRVFARLKPGETLAQARAEMNGIATNLRRAYPQTNKHVGAFVWPIRDVLNGTLTPIFVLTLLGAAGFVLLLACANCANLQLVRASARTREMVVRAALGAGRWRLLRQLLAESLLLAALGAGVGLLVAHWVLRLVSSLLPTTAASLISGWSTISLDRRTMMFAIGAAVVAGLACGLLPAFRASKPNLNEELKSGGGSSAAPEGRRTRSVLAGAQIAVAMILVIGAGLMVRGFYNLLGMATQFQPRTLLTMQVDLSNAKFRTREPRANFYAQVLQALRSLPGVTGTCVFTTPPLSNNGTSWSRLEIRGRSPGRTFQGAVVQVVSPGTFATLHLSLLRGRDFSSEDNAQSLPVAIVSSELAQLYWPGQDPLGKQFRLGPLNGGVPGPWLSVVGVASDVEYDWTDNAPEPAAYLPYEQSPPDETFLALRAAVPPDSLIAPARREIALLNTDVSVSNPRTLGRLIYDQMAGLVEIGGMMTALGFVALLLAAAGVYGLMAYNVSQRTHEIGIRMALGATPRGVVGKICAQGMLLAGLSSLIGLLGAAMLTPLVSSFYYGVRPLDPLTFAGVAAFLLAAAATATYVAARRAAKVDPMITLRYE
jgi:putative ABC transport system permease protein